MTTSVNASFDMTRDTIIRVGLQLTGTLEAGKQPDANQIELASELLNMMLKALQNDGIILRALEQASTSLTAGVAKYTLAADTLDIDDRSVYVSSGTTDLRLDQISRGQYMELSLKGSTGQPTQFYVEKTDTVSIYFYPTPDANWTSVTYPRVRLLKDLDSGSVTPDLPSKYLLFLTYQLAADYSLHTGMLPRYQILAGRAEAEKVRAENDDTERGPVSFRPDYGRKFNGRW